MQTPQGFRRAVLEAAHRGAADGRRGHRRRRASSSARGAPVLVVPGAEEAFKVTRPLDLLLAEAVLAAAREAAVPVTP